ncbi:hypothetical protein [Halococcus agarilyticus]|uniref:hypothetical protein n=1 Tax=Halococcus agarilyticus TaxID=1232219 RepID=UPI000677DCFD|nr:hypothetical protein [Halococcus agarilyticus]
MGSREPIDVADRTHTVVTRTSSSSDDVVTNWIEVENSVVELVMQYGTAVHLSIDGPMLEEHSPETLATVRRLARLRKDEQLLTHGNLAEYRASLPDESQLVRECLTVDHETDAGPGSWRVFGIHELAVVREDAWLYHSVPHHRRNRDVNAVVDGLVDELNEMLDTMFGSGSFPVGPLLSWETDGRRYEIESDHLRVDTPTWQEWAAFTLSGLTDVYPEPERLELVCRWGGTPKTDSVVLRGLGHVFDRLTADPPTRIGVPDRETLDEVVAALGTVAEKLDYDLTIHD